MDQTSKGERILVSQISVVTVAVELSIFPRNFTLSVAVYALRSECWNYIGTAISNSVKFCRFHRLIDLGNFDLNKTELHGIIRKRAQTVLLFTPYSIRAYKY